MTIDEAKKDIEDALCNNCLPSSEAIEMVLASLEAWEKVRQEAKQEIESNWGFERIGEENILAIIDRHLKEIEE